MRSLLMIYPVKKKKAGMKRQLTQNVSHELKTPVSSIQGYLETILSNPDLSPDKRQFFLERCYSQSTRLTGLLRDISVLNRLDEASEMFDLTEVNITKLIAEIQKECSQDMEEKHTRRKLSSREIRPCSGITPYSIPYSGIYMTTRSLMQEENIRNYRQLHIKKILNIITLASPIMEWVSRKNISIAYSSASTG